MTQVQLEKALGLKSPTVSRWETGKVVPSATADILMRRLAADAGVPHHPVFTVLSGGIQMPGTGTYRASSDVRVDSYVMEG